MGAGKTTLLLDKTAQLLAQVPASQVLILCSNHIRQQKFLSGILSRLKQPLAQLPIYTYAGLVRTSLFNFWPLAEHEIAHTLKTGVVRIRPELAGQEDSELLLRWLLTRLRQEAASRGQEPFKDFPGTDQHILKQLIRRLQLRSQNQLSRKDMQSRSVLLEEPCQTEVTWLEQQFDLSSYALRVLDPNKQLDVFHRLLQQDTPLTQDFRQHIRHLIVDDVDETIAAQQHFVTWLSPSLSSLWMAADVDGGSRRGYLNAYPYDWNQLKALHPGETLRLERNDILYQAGQTLLHNWKTEGPMRALPPVVQLTDSAITRLEMLDQVVQHIGHLLLDGYNPGDLCLALPKTDVLGFHQLQTRLQKQGIPVQLLSGTRRPSDNPRCRGFIYLIQWCKQPQWQAPLSPWEVKTVLMQVMQLHHIPGVTSQQVDHLTQMLATYETSRIETPLLAQVPELPADLPPEARQRYQQLTQWLQRHQDLPFDQLLYAAFSDMIAPLSSEQDAHADLGRMIDSYLRQREIYQRLASQSENLSPWADLEQFNYWWLRQVKSGAVADTPEMPEAIRDDAIIIGTPQKIIDHELTRKVQFWLDVSSREWARSDNAPLYNAWVHSAVWDGETAAFSEAFNEAVIRTRAGHITRGLMLLATEQVYAYASELDDLGFNHNGQLQARLLSADTPHSPAPLQRAVLRPDQAPILHYQSGTMAISAVPGAGKTFVNVELLLELITRGVDPERILVLTYMDSAAKTLLSRLKQKLSGHTRQLPVISTIHSLAFRILTENDHAILTGQSTDDLTILDDFAQGELLHQVALATQPESSKAIQEWQRGIDRGIKHCKMFGVQPDEIQAFISRHPDAFRLQEFLPALRVYDELMRRNGYLDFTDLITRAVGLLEGYPDIRARYQQQFSYIIEDEAQDSSRLLQQFIRLIGGERPNLIRTGDTNQSITTTFSSADTSVFREFIQSADTVVQMDRSGRCAPAIMHLANQWVTRASGQPDLGMAFQPVAMQPVPGQNPDLLYPIQTQLFDLDGQEENWIAEQIQQCRQQHPNASMAVLVRSNAQVNRVTSMLHQAKIPAVSLSEQMNTSPVFGIILAYLKLLANPGDLIEQAQWHRLMVSHQIAPENSDRQAFLENTPLFYQSPVDLPDEFLKQWAYDWLDFSRHAAGGNLGTLIARVSDRFFSTVSDRSNGYLCALMAQDILASHPDLTQLSPLEIVIQQFETYQKSWRKKNSFTELLNQHASEVVQVMNIHKSKGQEFDIVWMPFLQEESFPHDLQKIRLDEGERLTQDLERLIALRQKKTLSDTYQDDKKREKIEEEARLIYVGITRARRALFLSAHQQSLTRYQKLRNTRPALAFEQLAALLSAEPPPVSSQPAGITTGEGPL